MMRMLSGGVPIPAFRPQDVLAKAWTGRIEERLDCMAEQIARVGSLVVLDTVVLESDGTDVGAVQQRLEELLSKKHKTTLPIVAPTDLSLCERQMLSCLRLAVAERVVTDAKEKKKKSPVTP